MDVSRRGSCGVRRTGDLRRWQPEDAEPSTPPGLIGSASTSSLRTAFRLRPPAGHLRHRVGVRGVAAMKRWQLPESNRGLVQFQPCSEGGRDRLDVSTTCALGWRSRCAAGGSSASSGATVIRGVWTPDGSRSTMRFQTCRIGRGESGHDPTVHRQPDQSSVELDLPSPYRSVRLLRHNAQKREAGSDDIHGRQGIRTVVQLAQDRGAEGGHPRGDPEEEGDDMKRTYRCGHCGGSFSRDDVVPPRGAVRPPGMPWRCRPCHARILMGELRAAMVFGRRHS